MTGLLSDLAARFAPQAAAPIQPRPAFRFEDEGGAEGFHEIAAEAAVPVAAQHATPARTHPAAPPARDADASTVQDTPGLHPPHAAATEKSSAPGAPDMLPGAPRPDDQRHEGENAAPAPLTSAEAREGAPVQVERITTREIVHERVEAARVAQNHPNTPERTPRPDTALSEAAPDTAPSITARPEPAPVPTAEPPQAALTVRIGRIEVRAPAPPAQAPATPRPAPAPAPQAARPAPAAAPSRSGLTDYLGWRR